MTQDHDTWKWQEPETAWKGVGIYHITMVVSSREDLLGTLVIPNDNPEQAHVVLSAFGEEIKDCVRTIPDFHPEIQILALRMMPDHVHFILHVHRKMDIGIRAAMRGFWQAAKAIGRAYTSSIDPNGIRNNQRRVDPIFLEKPFIRPMSRKGQLQSMIHYVLMNPQRLATKRLKPGYFYVQHDVEIGGRTYEAVGNIKLLQAAKINPVHVRSMWVRDAEEHGDDQALRKYKNGCVLAAREGAIMVSPFISEHERAVLDVLLKEKHPIIYIADNGFGKYYKPFAALFDAVADGRMLILSPWSHDPKKKHVTRAECIAMNKMAEEISTSSIVPNDIRGN
jgi:hypothetical protein